MKNKNPPDERDVYLALKNVFKGPNAEVRQLKSVRRLLALHQNDPDVANLLKAYSVDIIYTITRTLLAEEIFASTLKAKIRFPEIFDVSPAQGAEREASEAEAAINEANAIKGAVQYYSGNVQDAITSADVPEVAETESVETCHLPELPIGKNVHAVPSLFPVYLPLRTQHRILTQVQSILEDACFEFGKRAMPDISKKRGWQCSEAAELNLWVMEFLDRLDHRQFTDMANHVGKPSAKLLRSVANIRHTAVHRICISAKGLEQFMIDAESFATLLGDTKRLDSLTKLRRNVHQTIEELERNKHVLGSKLTETLKRIAAQRAELDRAEKMAIDDTVKEDGEYQAFAGKNLEEAALCSVAPPPVATAKEEETSSNPDEEDTTEDNDKPDTKLATGCQETETLEL